MKFLLIALALFMLAAAPGTIGTMTLTNQPAYGGEATFHVRLEQKVQLVNSVVWCGQVQDGAYRNIFMQEQFLLNSNWAKGKWEGDLAFGPLDGNWDNQTWDTTKTAYCSAVVFKDINRNGKANPTAITPWVTFTVPEVGP